MKTAQSERFKIFVPMLTASLDEKTGQKMLSGIASSSVKDLHGDRMTENAIAEMERSANNNMTIFLNHSYAVPEDVAGSVTAAATTRTADGEIVDLHFEIAINEENERAVKAWSAIKGSSNRRPTKLGLSIGAMIPEGGATFDSAQGGYIINHIDLLETSIVGVPANPRSWVEYATKALNSHKAAQPVQIGTPALTLDSATGEYVIRGQIGDIAVSQGQTQASAEPESTEPEPESTELLGAGELLADNAALWVTQCEACQNVVDGFPDGAAGCSKCGSKGPFIASRKATVEPDKADSSITVIQIDTGDGGSADSDEETSQEAPQSDPENGATEVVTTSAGAATGEDQALALSLLGSHVTTALKSQTDLIRALSIELTAARTERDEAFAERDEAVAMARSVLTSTSATLEALKATPVGRRTVVADVTDQFDREMSGVYSAAALGVIAKAKSAEAPTQRS